MPPIVWIILVFIALIVVPKVGMAVCLPIIAIWFVGEVGIMGTFIGLIPLALVMTLALEISPKTGYVIRQSFAERKINAKELMSHILLTLASTYIVMLALILLGHLFVKIIGDFAIILLIVCGVLAGIAFGVLAKTVSEGNLGSYDEISKKLEQQRREAELQAERAAVEAERQQQIAAAEAKLKAEREKQAALNAQKQQQAQAEKERMRANKQTINRFWALLVKNYGIDPELRESIKKVGTLGLQYEDDSEKSVWARNDEHFAAVEKLIQSTGFSVGELQPPRFPYESAFLEYVFAKETPILGCAGLFSGLQVPQVNGRALPMEYFNEYVYDVRMALGSLSSRYKDYIDVYREDCGIIKAGLKGEYAVQDILDMHAGSFLVLHDLRLEFPGKDGKKDSVETDTLVLAPNGAFAIEVKNYGASGRYKIIVTADGNWYKEYPPRWDDDTPKREAMPNPFAQNDRHIAFLERFINELLGRDMATWAHVENIICIANDEVTLENDPNAKQTLTRVSNLYNHLTYDRTQKFTVEELNQIKAALEERALPGKKYPIPDHSANMKLIVDWYRYILDSVGVVTDAAAKCAKDHPEYLDMIK